MNVRILFVAFFCCWQFVVAQDNSDFIVVPFGSKVMLTATSEGAVSYQWYRNGAVLEGAVEEVYKADTEGDYSVISFNSDGCQSFFSQTVTIRFSEILLPPSGQKEQFFCAADSPLIADIEVTGNNIVWYDSPDEGQKLSADTLLEDGVTYYAAQTSGEEVESEERLGVTVRLDYCPDLGVNKSVDEMNPRIGQEVIFTLAVENTHWAPLQNVVISDKLPSGFDYRWHQADKGSYDISSGYWQIPHLDSWETAELNIRAEVLPQGEYRYAAWLETSEPEDTAEWNNLSTVEIEPSCLKIYNLFSPNGDGINDVFRIDCIEKYPDNTLEVFNRYGNTVFRQKGYDNTWQGESNVKNTISRNGQLPAGTYYYVLSLGNGTRPVTGWLFIMR